MKVIRLLTKTTEGAKLNITVVRGNKRIKTYRYDSIKMFQQAYTQIANALKGQGYKVIVNERFML